MVAVFLYAMEWRESESVLHMLNGGIGKNRVWILMEKIVFEIMETF